LPAQPTGADNGNLRFRQLQLLGRRDDIPVADVTAGINKTSQGLRIDLMEAQASLMRDLQGGVILDGLNFAPRRVGDPSRLFMNLPPNARVH